MPRVAWRPIRRRQIILYGIVATYLPVCVTASLACDYFFGTSLPGLIIALIWMIGSCVAWLYLATFSCPRCGHAFFYEFWRFRLGRRTCGQCGWPLGHAYDPKLEPPVVSQQFGGAVECLRCGTQISSGSETCSTCGWSYTQNGTK